MKTLCVALSFVLLSIQPVSAAVPASFCYAKLLQQRQDRSDQLTPSAALIGRVAPEHAWGERFVFELQPGRHWHSRFHTPGQEDFQADPRALLFAIEDERTAQFLGFGMPQETQLILPGAAWLNESMDQIESRSQSTIHPITFGFRWKRVSAVLDPEKYLRLFHAGFQPLIEGDARRLHDYGYHLPSLLIAGSDLARARRLAGNVLDFVALLQRKDGHFFKKALFRKNITLLLERESQKIDLGSGNTGLGLARGYYDKAYIHGIRNLVRTGFSEESWLKSLVESVFPHDLGVLLRLTQFLQERREQDPEFSRVWNEEREAWQRATELRRRRIVELVHRLAPR